MKRQELFHADVHLHRAASYLKLGIKNPVVNFLESLVNNETAATYVGRTALGYGGASRCFPSPCHSCELNTLPVDVTFSHVSNYDSIKNN